MTLGFLKRQPSVKATLKLIKSGTVTMMCCSHGRDSSIVKYLLYLEGLQLRNFLEGNRNLTGSESSDTVRFDLGPLLQGQMRIDNLKYIVYIA